MKKLIALSTLLALGALGIGCGGTDATNTANNAKPANASNTNATAPANTNAGTPANSNTNSATTETSKAEIGVPACDEYLAKMDEYLANPKVPEAVRTAQKDAKEKYVSAWKTAASTPQGKAGLETGCKAALDSMKSLPTF